MCKRVAIISNVDQNLDFAFFVSRMLPGQHHRIFRSTSSRFPIEFSASRGINVLRTYVGHFLSTLDTKGADVTLLNISGREDWVRFLDQDTEAYAWPVTRLSRVNEKIPRALKALELDDKLPEVVKLIKPHHNIYYNLQFI